MADEIDALQEKSAFYHQMELHKSRKPDGPLATGYCLNCEAPLDEGRRWCNADCRDDWQKENQ